MRSRSRWGRAASKEPPSMAVLWPIACAITQDRAIVSAVSPRPGGEADKFGNRYEGRWTVGKLLEVLAGRAQSFVLEQRGEGGAGVEFTVVRNHGGEEGHQLK